MSVQVRPMAWRLPRMPAPGPWLVPVLAGVTLGLALNALWWAMLSPAARPGVQDFVIPKGTAAAVAAGEFPLFIPDALSLREGEVLRVRNDDVSPHQVAGRDVAPGATEDITMRTITAPGSLAQDQLVCTVHPAGYIGLSIDERPPLSSIIVPSLLLGLPLGALAAVVIALMKRLDMGD